MFRRRALRRRLASLGVAAVPDDVLRRLARALDAGPGGALCVPPAPPDDRRLRLALARAFCFPDLRDLSELRRMPHCTDNSCCNPYHWSRLCKPETPPPPYTRFAMDDYKPKDHGESTEDARRTDHERFDSGSMATDGEERQSWETEWCRLAYWELTQRVGRQFGVRMRAVDVFGGGGGACGSGRHGLCLDALDRLDHRPDLAQPDQVRKTRAKIGLGVTLSLEGDGVWVYNRGAEPVFVSSPALDAAAARALLVWRVAAGHCLRVFPPPPFAAPRPAPPRPALPRDPRSVRISFAKGWGPKYSRRDVTACPCWLEVLLAPPS
ncbi:mothers against decapentaplegic homolog 6 [Bombyx mandarina]|uniref:Mothers against decapentaplegic homolog n=1 Tax=Bombyx mandarina TaxID=7092 RepID=A0A6J2KCV2_BOMMA|nr:mothers against decapentaplegic homolog 6 [Bombyx mandarina]